MVLDETATQNVYPTQEQAAAVAERLEAWGAGAVKKLSEVIYDDDAPKGEEAAAAANTLALFERELGSLENRLSTSLKLRRLGARKEVTEEGREVMYDDLLSHLQFCVIGIRQPVQLPRTPR